MYVAAWCPCLQQFPSVFGSGMGRVVSKETGEVGLIGERTQAFGDPAIIKPAQETGFRGTFAGDDLGARKASAPVRILP